MCINKTFPSIMLKKRPKKSFFWLLRGILGPNRHQKVFKRPITHLKTSQEFKFPIKNLPRWLLLPQKCKKWWYAIRAPCVRRPKTIKIKNFKKSSKNFLFFGVFQLNIHPLWGSKAQSWTSFKLNLMSARDPQCDMLYERDTQPYLACAIIQPFLVYVII